MRGTMYSNADRINGQSSCRRKVKYGHLATAQKAAVKMQAQKSEPFEAYPCRHCDGYHIGHPRFWGWTKEQLNAVGIN